jgi:hypothetical protein
MKAIFELFTVFSLGRIFDLLRSLAKSYLTRSYIALIDTVRGIYLIALLAMACFFLLLSGFIMLHVAIFLYLPWAMSDKLLLLLILSITYILLPLILLLVCTSRKSWLKASGAQKLIDELSEKK